MENEKQENKQAPTMVYEATKAAEALSEENARMEANIKQLQELKAFEALGGRSVGKEQEVAPVEISPKQYAEDVLAGRIKLK